MTDKSKDIFSRFTARDIEVLIMGLSSLKSEAQIDHTKLAARAGFKNAASAAACFRPVKNKWDAYIASKDGGEDAEAGNGNGSGAPAAGGKKRKAARPAAGGDEDDNGGEGTPAKKKKGRSRTPAKPVKSEENLAKDDEEDEEADEEALSFKAEDEPGLI